MRFWQRVKSFVNKAILRREEPIAPVPPTEPPPIPTPTFAPEPVYQPQEPTYFPEEAPSETLHIQIEEADGTVHDLGYMTYEDAYQATLLSSEEFHNIYGFDVYNTDIIEWLEDYYGIDWDWDTWREDYEARNG